MLKLYILFIKKIPVPSVLLSTKNNNGCCSDFSDIFVIELNLDGLKNASYVN
jgi:hypothetical protein